MDDLDPDRLSAAAHELGHAIVWREANVDLGALRVVGHGHQAHGYVEVRPRPARNDAEVRAYLAGLLGGREAEIRWCEENGVRFHERTCRTDLADFHRQHRQLGPRASKGQVRADARGIVRANWRLIVRLAPRLARTGRITL